MNFSTVKSITIPNGKVVKISQGNTVLWQAKAENEANLIPKAINADGTAYVGTNGERGYKSGYQLNTSGTESALNGIEVTGFMPVTLSDTLYFKNITWPYNGSQSGNCWVVFYDSNFTKLFTSKLTSDLSRWGGCTYDANKNLVKMVVKTYMQYYSHGSDPTAYFRISAAEITGDSIITVNQPIE